MLSVSAATFVPGEVSDVPAAPGEVSEISTKWEGVGEVVEEGIVAAA